MRRENVVWIAGLTIVVEALACVMRFGFGLESTRDTSALASLTFGYRIHHGYFGIILIAAAAFMRLGPAMDWTLRIGWMLLLTDVIHHFAILWPITGDPQFHIQYPQAV